MKGVAPRDLSALPEGTRVSDYRLESVLGHGGFGITYLAMDLSLNQRVAIKEYYPREFAIRDRKKAVRASGNAEARENFVWGLERFREEARTLAWFSHPNVVAVRRLFEANGTSYIVMDFCEGEPLDKVIRRDAPLPAGQLERIFYALLDGLEHVHAAGVMHRDLKPANIFIRSDGSPVLLDFGAARQALVNHSQSMALLATAHYAALEQYSIDEKQGPWTDIYGLAATCYHAATGEKPIDAPDRIRADKLQPIAVKAAGRYRRDFLLAIDAGLAVRPKDRPQSIASWRTQVGVAKYPVHAPFAAVAARAKALATPRIRFAVSVAGLGLFALMLAGLSVFAVQSWMGTAGDTGLSELIIAQANMAESPDASDPVDDDLTAPNATSGDENEVDDASASPASAKHKRKSLEDERLTDPPAPSSVAQHAVLRGGTITDEDYPASAIQNGEEGRSVAILTIGVDGRVVACSASGASPTLDAETCKLIMRRFRYSPAKDSNGQPIEEIKSQSVYWRLP